MRTPDCNCIRPLFTSDKEEFLLIGSVAEIEVCYTSYAPSNTEFKIKKVRGPLRYCPSCGKRYLEEVK